MAVARSKDPAQQFKVSADTGPLIFVPAWLLSCDLSDSASMLYIRALAAYGDEAYWRAPSDDDTRALVAAGALDQNEDGQYRCSYFRLTGSGRLFE